MCDATNKQIVEDVVEVLVGRRKMFSAFDVTKQARHEGADERHGSLKSAIHGLWGWMQKQGYKRTLVDLGAPIQPWLYHPTDADVQSYTDANQVGASTQAPKRAATVVATPAGPVVTSVQSSSLVDLGQKTRTNSEDRLNIGAKDLNLISASSGGLLVGQRIFVSALDGGELIISKSSSFKDIATYVVDRDKRIRISNWVLNTAIRNPGLVLDLQYDKQRNVLVVS